MAREQSIRSAVVVAAEQNVPSKNPSFFSCCCNPELPTSSGLMKLQRQIQKQNEKFMHNIKCSMQRSCGLFILALAALLLAGCQSNTEQRSDKMTTETPTRASAPAQSPAAVAAPAPVAAAAPKLPRPTVRIKAGRSTSLTDFEGNVWLPDQGFTEGETTERPDIQIANTKSPDIYRSEHYSMTSFSYPVPNGKYIVKLHFCETFEGITQPGERVFSFNVEGHEFKDFDVWVKAGGFLHAYIETVNVEVTDGKLDISFTPKVENPQINGIEIIPAS
jgi:outer membrane murein-binding lipoprotein Lpp